MTSALERAARKAARSAVRRLAQRVAIAVVLGPSLALMIASSVAAHGETFFQLGTDRIQPGGQVELRADLGAGDAFDIVLIATADGTRRDLGVLPATEEGHLQTFLTIPVDVPAGDYLVEIAWDLTVLRAPLTVAGSPIDDGGGGQQPGQDDGFAATPSSGAGGFVAAPSGGPVASAGASATVRGRRDPVEGLGIAAAAGLGALILLGVVRFRRRPGAPGA